MPLRFVSTTSPQRDSSNDDSSSDNQSSEGAPAGSAGTLTVGDEVIDLDHVRCFLEEQDVAGSDGKILLTGQGFGTTASGDELVLDVTRYDEDSLFTRDDIQVDIRDPLGDDFYSWDGSADLGTIERDDSTLASRRIDVPAFRGRHRDDGCRRTRLLTRMASP